MQHTISSLGAGYLAGTLSPVDAVDRCLGAISELDDRIGAWQDVYAEDARAAAKAAELAIGSGHRVGPFHGVPFALKDIVELEGRVTTAGSKPWSDRRSPITATIATRLIAAGGILLGKTKTVEFAMGGWGTNQHMGTPWNPWDADVARTPGGSSCGSGAAVASGMAVCAVGTDTGGSVRLPAAFCGIVGLKTTEGLLPTSGIVPLSHTLDTPGPMARTVLDAALMFDVMAGPGSRLGVDLEAAAHHRGVAGLHLASLGESERALVEPDQLAAYDSALDLLSELGARVTPFDPPTPFGDMKEATFIIVTAEGYYHHHELMDDLSAPIDEHVRARIRPGADITSRDYVAAVEQRRADQVEFQQAFAPFDALVTPTTPMLPPPVADADEGSTPAHFTRAINYLAMCGTSVASGVTPSGLPGSLQIGCRGGAEALSLQIAATYEAARGSLPEPPLSML